MDKKHHQPADQQRHASWWSLPPRWCALTLRGGPGRFHPTETQRSHRAVFQCFVGRDMDVFLHVSSVATCFVLYCYENQQQLKIWIIIRILYCYKDQQQLKIGINLRSHTTPSWTWMQKDAAWSVCSLQQSCWTPKSGQLDNEFKGNILYCMYICVYITINPSPKTNTGKQMLSHWDWVG